MTDTDKFTSVTINHKFLASQVTQIVRSRLIVWGKRWEVIGLGIIGLGTVWEIVGTENLLII